MLTTAIKVIKVNVGKKMFHYFLNQHFEKKNRLARISVRKVLSAVRSATFFCSILIFSPQHFVSGLVGNVFCSISIFCPQSFVGGSGGTQSFVGLFVR
ncbi:MAG: hypothetical protein ACK4FS_03850 [Flavobacterium sp.]